MARATNILRFPCGGTFKRTFEELPLFSERAANGDWFKAGLVDGEVEIEYDHAGEWHISDIRLNIDNGRMGSAAKAKTIRLCAEENAALYSLILDVFCDRYADTIAEWIDQEQAWAA